MKSLYLLATAALATALSLPVLAGDMGDMKMDGGKADSMKTNHMDGMKDMAKKPMAAHGTGVVKAVDLKAGTITLSHGPIAELKWPAMTMPFKVADANLLASVKPGDKVAFTCTAEGMSATVTEIKPAK